VGVAVGLAVIGAAAATPAGRQAAAPDWARVEAETLRHFQALLRFDTADPPGHERPAADYLRTVLEAEGFAVQEFALEPRRPSIVARLKGSGRRRPLLLMAHTDVVNVDPARWTFPPFSATRDGGYVYGRGAVDDKDNVVASLMVMLLLKRLGVALDRDVIFLAESGEEGSTRVGIQFLVNRHLSAIEAEYCLAEGGSVVREGGRAKFASVQTLEKIPYAVELVARGPAGHGSVPLVTNAVTRLSRAVVAVSDWKTPARLNETTSAYFRRLAEISPPEQAARYRSVLDPARIDEADEYFRVHEPRHASMLRTSISPNVVQAGYRINVIPSEVKATLDVRALTDEDVPALLDRIRKVINDPDVEVRLGQRDTRPFGRDPRIDSEAFLALEAAFREHYGVVTIPSMSTGATDMAYLRGKGIECYGIGPGIDVEDGPKGFGAHSDQERILESELHRFLRAYWDVVVKLAAACPPGAAARQAR
jgi:acetylornithine deacetylase/succinyl-diaminopimelate desuccinylase-like protein